MTHPLLAVRHLAGGNMSYWCSGGPSWFRALNAGALAADPTAVPIVWGRPPADVAGLGEASAFVGINCREASDERLRGAGFAHVRRYAALPNAQNPRWFIPLDSARASAAALSLYRPVRLAGRVVHAAVRLAARTGLPIWYRDDVFVARRELDAVEQILAGLFAGRSARLALAAGATGRTQHGKVTMAVVSASGEILAVIKSGASGVARRLVQHEASVLEALAARPAVAARVPQLLFAGEVGGSFVHVQTPLRGSTGRCELGASHAALLAALSGGERKRAVATRLVQRLRRRVAALPASCADLRGIMDALTPRLERLTIPATVVHGDFAPWNIRVREGVAMAFDWEYGEVDGLPLIDACNHALLVGYLVHKWTIGTAIERLGEMARSAPLRMKPAEVEALQLVHLLDVVARFASEGAEDEQMSQWFLELLLELAGRSREASLEGVGAVALRRGQPMEVRA